MNSSGWVAVIVVLLLIIGGAWWYTQQPVAQTNVNVNQNATTTDEVPAMGTSTEPKTVTVDYSATGFTPKSITINKGDTVTFTNSSGGNMWVASAMHPGHEGYDGTTRTEHCVAGATPPPFDQCVNGASYSFKFDKTGSFNYHNHSSAQFFGTVVVQ